VLLAVLSPPTASHGYYLQSPNGTTLETKALRSPYHHRLTYLFHDTVGLTLRIRKTPASMSPRLASRLVGSCLRLLTALLQADRRSDKDRWMKDQGVLHEVFGRLKIWALDFNLEDDILDRVLEVSEHLKEPIVSLLADLAECLLYYQSGFGLLGRSSR
jgi:hypothetical protein